LTDIVVLGDRDSDRLAHREADAAIALFPAEVDAAWLGTEHAPGRELAAVDGVWLMSGGPYHDDDAVYEAIDYCIDSSTPFLGTCSGFQYACLGLARRHGVDVAHPETDPNASDALIAPLTCSLHHEQRLVEVLAGTRLGGVCGVDPFLGFHNCGYGLVAEQEHLIEQAGAVISARALDVGAEAVELPGHPFFIATAFHPQIGSSKNGILHPLLAAFVEAARLASEGGRAALPGAFPRWRLS
jgi:CTP synthase (UTP-ammonia lyase)